jgi:protein-disulfide isomerase
MSLDPPLATRDHRRGELTAPVSLVEFGDYQCPFCGSAQPIVERLVETLGDRMCFAFRHFPIVSVHPQALVAAEVAEAAAAQGRFWDMHATLFAHQDALEQPWLERYAVQLGLDVARVVADLRARRFVARVRGDLHSGAVSGVGGTPTFFVNGARWDGPHDFAPLYEALAGEAGAGVLV